MCLLFFIGSFVSFGVHLLVATKHLSRGCCLVQRQKRRLFGAGQRRLHLRHCNGHLESGAGKVFVDLAITVGFWWLNCHLVDFPLGLQVGQPIHSTFSKSVHLSRHLSKRSYDFHLSSVKYGRACL